MAKSISQVQAELLAGRFLDRFKENKNEYLKASGLPIVDRLIVLATANFVIRVEENLKRLGKISTGTLASEIRTGEIIKRNGKYTVNIGYPKNSKAAKYYDYVNKGVMGVKSKKPDSPYKFKTETVGEEFNKSIRQWIKTNSIAAKLEDQRTGLSKTQKKRKAILKAAEESKNLKSLAYVFARSIKRKGLPQTKFFSNAANEYFGQKFFNAISKTAKADVIVFMKSSIEK